MLFAKLKKAFEIVFIAILLAFTASHFDVYAAAVLDPATQTSHSIAPYELSNTDLSTGSVKAYRPWFENGAWQGDLVEYDVLTTGVLSTDIDLSVSPPTTAAGANWSARIQFNAAITADANYWSNSRKIITHNGTSQTAFLYGNLSATQKTALISSDYVDYIRGDQSKETDKGGTFRKRYNLLGDIIHSNPVYVGKPQSNFSLPGYSTFKTATSTANPAGQSDRSARVYVGANDGMVHAFDAATGNEIYAYIPSMILGDLHKLAASPFVHTYFVDGQLSAGDAYFGDGTNHNWRTLLVGGLGSGGKGLFALDITDDSLSAEAANTGTDLKILFEKDGSDNDIGYIHGKAQIALLPDNKWYVISGNGYGSSSGLAKLILVDKDGTVSKIATNATTGNGLSAPTLVDVNNDFIADYAYAGDLQGNMWKFNLTSKAAATKLYAAGADKPITTAPDITRHPNGGVIVFFGTGSLLSSSDAANVLTQSIFGIWDGTNNTTILTQTLGIDEHTYTNSGTTISTKVRTASNTAIDWTSHKGWRVDLNISGERLVSDPVIRAGRLQFVTNNPASSDYGDAWLVELNYLNGGTGPGVFLDLNADTYLNDSDKTNSLIPIGIHLGDGSFSGPRIARVSNTRDSMFINGLFLPVPPQPCTENCSSGFQLGHVDVDTDSPNGGNAATNTIDQLCYVDGDRAAGVAVDASGDAVANWNQAVLRQDTGSLRTKPADGLGGATDGHQHEYDKVHGQVYIDYINLEPRCAQKRADNTRFNSLQKLFRATEVGMGNSKEFFVIVANADLSPGSDMTIGNKKWNVVEYQKMIQQKLDAWVASNFTSPLVDNDGDSLIFTIDQIINASGTFRNAFNDRAIADGGLLPTKPSCVYNDPLGTWDNKGRWRGGALTTQVISKADFISDPSRLIKQTPTDLYDSKEINGQTVWLKEDTNVDGVFGAGDVFYGGLIANYNITNNPVFLYESALFWHYSGSCYGTANWEADVNGAVNSSTSSEAVKSTLAALELDLVDAKNLYTEMVAAGESVRKLNRQLKLISDLEKKIDQLRSALDGSNVISTGVPVQPTDATPTLQPSLGPNFRTGRRTWIDLMP